MENYTPLKPFLQQLEYESGEQIPYRRLWDVTNPLLHHPPEFSLGGNGIGRRDIAIHPSPMTLSEMFFPDSMIDRMVAKTNSYAREVVCPPPNLKM